MGTLHCILHFETETNSFTIVKCYNSKSFVSRIFYAFNVYKLMRSGYKASQISAQPIGSTLDKLC